MIDFNVKKGNLTIMSRLVDFNNLFSKILLKIKSPNVLKY